MRSRWTAWLGLLGFLSDVRGFKRVYNGDLVSPTAYGFMVQVYGRSSNQAEITGLCSGTIVDEHRVLTAAHCCYNIASYTVHTPTETREGRDFVIHPDYTTRPAPKADLCVLYLGDPLASPELAQIADDPARPAGLYTVLGFGETGGVATANAVALYAATLQTTSRLACFVLTRNNWDAVTCTDGEATNTNICAGDSGGPLGAAVNGTFLVHGVASYGFREDCAQDLRAVYTTAATYKTWILSASGALDQGPPGWIGLVIGISSLIIHLHASA